MRVGRKLIGFLTVLVLCVCGVCLGVALLRRGDEFLDCFSILQTGSGRQRYETVAVNGDGTGCAAGWDGGTLRLAFFDLMGTSLGRWGARLPDELAGGTVAGLYPIGDRSVVLGVYGQDGKDGVALSLLRLQEGEEPQRLLRVPCAGESPAQCRAGTRLFSFSQDGGEVRFVLQSGEELTGYVLEDGSAGLRILARGTSHGVRSAVLLTDGALAVGGDGTLSIDGTPASGLPDGQRVRFLTQTGTGSYYLDAAALQLYYSDLTGSAVRRILSLDGATQGHSLSSLSITAQGGALLLLDGHELSLIRTAGREDLTRAIYASRTDCLFLLGLCLLAVLASAWVVWYVVCGLIWKGRMPMALQGSALILAAALVAGLAVYHFWTRPQQEAREAAYDTAVTDRVVRLVADRIGEQALESELSGALEGRGLVRDMELSIARERDGAWYDSGGDRAELSPAFAKGRLEGLEKEEVMTWREGERFHYLSRMGTRSFCLSYERAAQDGLPLWLGALLEMGVVTAVALLFLLAAGRNARKLARAAEQLSQARAPRRALKIRSCDELEGLASTLDSLAAALERREQEQQALIQSYRRFVPEQTLSLLGKRSIEEVDKSSFSTRHMAVMMVWFRFQEPVYSSAENSRLFFDSVNEIIERTASIATGQGGTVFNFAYDGYDVVMEEDCQKVVSAAVAMAQEVLSFNSVRSQKGLPVAQIRIALDVGEVMLGIVGDSAQIEPATISTSFSTVKKLIDLCGKLQANILCTESIVSGAGDYAGRYMGKCTQGDGPVRAYEIFSGDDYDVRRGKEATVRRFSEGVLALYSGEAARAKRIFLEIVHQNGKDGGARFYLYLADQIEKDPQRACTLDSV